MFFKKKENGARVKTPQLLQLEAVECGAASLGMILGYYKRYVPLEELRDKCGVSRDGSKASNVLKAAEKYGLKASGFKMEPEELRKLTMPVIVFWNFNHFLVVEGFTKDKVYLNDPALGHRTVSPEEFDQSFTGVVLTFEKGPDFEPGGKPESIVAALIERMEGVRTAVFYVFLTGFAVAIPYIVSPIFVKIFVDNYLVKNLESWVRPLIYGMLIAAFLIALLNWLKRYYLGRIESKLSVTESSKFLWHVLRLPMRFFGQRTVGDITNRITLNEKIARTIARDITGAVISAIMAVLYIVIMLFYSISLTFVAIVIALLNLLILRIISEGRKTKSIRGMTETSKLIGTSMNGISNIETLKSSGRETDFFATWSGYQAKVLNNMRIRTINQFFNAVPVLLNLVNIAVILGIGGMKVISGDISIGVLVAFQLLAVNFLMPINELVVTGKKIQELYGDVAKINDVMRYDIDKYVYGNETEETENKKTAEQIESIKSAKLKGYVELKNITFGYSLLEPPLIEDFNLSLKPGTRVALVGSSGCGKSTIAKLIMNLYQPWSGEIYFDGLPMTEVNREILDNSRSLVDQEILIFEGKIKDNITMWDPSISEEAIIKAAKDACIHDDITATKLGYNAYMLEGGRNFSGGQRQRLEIARAFACDPTIMVMDEATSALDPLTEIKINNAVRSRGCTTIIIAHRLSTIRDSDEIIVLDRGKVVQRGTHDELKDQEGLYADLIKLA